MDTLCIILSLPCSLLAAVVILTQSDLLVRVFELARKDGPKTRTDLEVFLTGRRGGWFWLKLMACRLCHSFHVAWVSAVTLAVTGSLDWPEAALSVGPIFIASMIAYRLMFPPHQPDAYLDAGGIEEAPLPWPKPKRGYTERLETSIGVQGGKSTLLVTGMDGLAKKAQELTFTDVPCDFPRCAELRAAAQRELREASEEGCQDCQKGGIYRKYWDIAIALMGG